jgi:preprotein translocase subunit SecA
VLHARHLADEAAIVAHAGEHGRVTVATNMAGRGTDIRLAAGIAELGGLHIVGTELHDSSRIDWQLYGRCARQGDPGTCRQFVSLDDEILDLGLGADRAERIRQKWQTETVACSADDSTNGQQLPQDRLHALFHRAQRNVERRHYGDRRMLMQQAERRRKLHEALGQDPYLDAVDGHA